MRQEFGSFFTAGLLMTSLPLLATEAAPSIRTETSELEISGYGELLFSYANYGADPKASARGSKRDQRLIFDTKRFIMEFEKELPKDFMFEAEVEFEHGGTGSTLELEYEEAGEYEVEVEKAGEVQLEKLFVAKAWGQQSVRIGRIPVAFGLLPLFHEPLDYLGTIRAESEEHFIPSAWNEMGIEYGLDLESHSFRAQMVNGLDSSGFSSQYWIVQGHQARFETQKATDPALVLRWDYHPLADLTTGLSLYYGDSSRNRPQPDLTKACSDPTATSVNSIAPCGYERTPLVLAAWHTRGQWGAWQTQSAILWGQLDNAELINQRNASLSQKYVGILRSPVGKEAFAAWTEWGYALSGFASDETLTPFVRLEAYDTVWKTAPGQLDQARLDRRVLTLGANYRFSESVFIKLDTSYRRFGSADLRAESDTRLNVGFIY